MHKLIHTACFLAALSVIPVSSRAQSPTDLSAQTPSPSSAPAAVPTLTLSDALARARANNPQFQAAVAAFGIARQDRVQARAGLLPSLSYNNSAVYTQPTSGPNATFIDRTGSSIKFVANNGIREYLSQGQAHEEIGLAGIAGYQRASAAQALAAAQEEIAARGLVATVVQTYYGLVVAQHQTVNAEQANLEAQHFLTISRQLQKGGEVAYSDVIKAELQANSSKQALDEAKLSELNARLTLAVLVFPNFTRQFNVVDDLGAVPALPPIATVQQLAGKNNPELRAAFASVDVSNKDLLAARAGHLPTLALDYFYGIDSPHFATRSYGVSDIGYSLAATLNIPIFSWGATQSKVKQAEIRQHQAKLELTAAQRQALADLESFYAEARTALAQLDVLRSSASLAADSLRLTTLRYQAGEATALEVVDAQNTLVQSRNALSSGQARYRQALANLQTLTGTF